MTIKRVEMDNKEFCEKISNLAIKSILYEVAASPKPGLVDRINSGAHRDMDFFTFLNSTSVLSSYFYKCTEAGLSFKNNNYIELLENIRPFGIKAEKDMFNATGGINTHKGIIFSAGIVASAAGSLYSRGRDIGLNDIIERIKEITRGIADELESIIDKENHTYGETLFIKYGVKGIRGEVEEGFATVVKFSYPIFKKLLEDGAHQINDILVQTLLHLIQNTQDSNILGRLDMDALKLVQEQAKEAIELGGIFTEKGKEFIKEMDKTFIEKNISPGGSADLLAVTMMLYMIENGDII